MLRSLLVFGTRPEAIKMAPVVHACQARPQEIDPIVCLSGQHREMLAPLVEYFGLQPEVNLDLMQPNQTLASLTARCIEAMDEVLVRLKPSCVVVQGDTTTVMATAVAAFYRRVPVVHVEAGLRTGNLLAPWPEEMNRRVADLVSSLYCAPTPRAAQTLLAEGAPPQQVHVTGNTVIDALLYTINRERPRSTYWQAKYPMLADHRLVLITGHRRESFGQGLANICQAIRQLAQEFPEHIFLYPVHLNPNVQEPVYRLLGSVANVHLVAPVPYPEFVWLMDRAYLILTDSGGIQEEAPSLRKPVLVMRETTERPEAVEAGAARLVGTDPEKIAAHARRLLLDPKEYAACQIDRNPYGDGQAAQRIVQLMLQQGW
ncbi:MAG: UDP-N-acetylglucosamine 2-epimerase (non-hydrolyzing) [Thermoguttaceae bacterium]|nr:UDP-N-acetylglucosamine 2-epimerase (non-hydrolyzing) [Thermoguttaceae bacterium]MDW8039692.1 UDP-N-acetylglucosamine 2-epimerase (non-hydrolyzing) [Thermoguttaceae bacterium]